MKKNGYVRRFLALFLTLMMIMADSSVTTFAATVGMVKQQNGDEQQAAVQANSSQHNVQINADEEFDLDKFVSEYPYIMLGSPITNWPNVKAESTIESVNVTGNTVLNDVTDNTEKKIYFVKGKEEWNLGSHKCEGDIIEQGEDQFRISISENSENLIVNIKKLVPYNIEIEADKKFSLSDFVKKYKYAMLGKKTSSGIEAISTIGKIDVGTTSVIVKVEDGIDVTDNTSVYFVKGENSESWGDALTNGSTVKQVNNSEQQFQTGFKIVVSVDESANDNWKVKFEKAQYEPGNSVDYENVLGNALHYGIVANDITVGGHMEANLAAGTLHGSSNMNTSKNRGGSGVSLIGAYEDSGWKIEPNSGSTGDLIIYTTEEALAKFHDSMRKNPSGVVIDTTTYTKEEIQEIVRNMVNDTIRTSIALNKNAIQASVPYTEALNGNRVDLDLTNSPAGTYYINFKVGDYERYNYNFKINGNQNIVLNIPDTTVYAKPYTLMIDGVKHNTTDSTSDIEAGLKYESSEKVIYNFPNATDVTLGQLEGTILAPKAYVHNDGVGGGCIVGNSVKISGSEWHCVSKNIPTVTSYALKAKKTVNGKAPVGNETGKFTFKLYKLDDKGNATLADTKTNGDGGLISFDAFGNITEVGTYWYKITEEGDVAGYTRDTTEYYAEVKVTAVSNNGVIISKNANVTYHEDSKDGATVTIPTFNNTKKENETSASINVRKTFTNGSADKAFSFKLIPVGNAPMPEGTENGMKSINASQNDGIKSFGNIKYTEAGIYTYEVTEDSSNAETGITYDNSIWKVTVNVPEGFETPTVTYSNGKDTPNTVTAEFINSKYEAAGSLSLAGSKKLAGKTLEAGEFNFEVTGTGLTSAVKASNTAEGEVNFGQIASWNGVEDKTFTFEVGEVNDGKMGYTYDGTKYTVKVKATFDNATKSYSYALEEGTSKDVTIDAKTGAISLPRDSFQNSYTKAAGSLSLVGSKKLDGKTLETGEFNFEVTGTGLVTAVKASNTADGKVDFGQIASWNGVEDKTFTFEVGEVNDGKKGYTYDGTKYTVKVKATFDNATKSYSYALEEGTSKDVTIDAATGAISLPENSFTNTYTATGSTTLTATKKMTGRSFQSGDNWTFTVTASPTTAPMPEHPVVTTSATSGNSETLDFGKINYTLDNVGTYVYTIIESGNVTNVENDPIAVRTVTVTVTDNGDGTLNVQKTEDENGLTFTNKYAEGETTLGVTKVLSGREFKEGDAWTFNLTADSETAPMPAETSVTTTATSGNRQSLTFGTIKYSLADVGNTYTYTITESGSGEGVTNDPNATRTVTVTVAEGSDGKLAITRTESEGGTVFTNIYNAAGSLTLEANKKLKNKTLEAGAFSFELKELTAENTKVLETIPNEADGSVNFTTINYTLADVGTHTYTVSEVKGSDGTVTYDGTVYTVEVTVTDAGNGTLNVSKVIKKNGEKVDSIDFTNTYIGEIEIAGTKTWNDNGDQDGIRPTSITVNLLANGEKVKDQKVTPDGNGNWNYKFEKLSEYNENGKITYTVTEDAVEGYTTELDGNNFINTHVPETTEISGTKTWDDADDQDGKRPENITVKLLANGEEVNSQTVTPDEDGSWAYSFTDLPKFVNGQEITYTVSETPVEDYSTTYDGYNIINSYTPGQTSATITKLWADADNQDGIRPDSITVTLLADGKETGTTATLTAANNWTETITGLPEKANGKTIEYTWAEKDIPDGYELTDNSTDGTVTTLTNTHTTEVTSISGTKTWNDAEDQDGKRPESITVRLLANGIEKDSQTVKADEAGSWTYKFTDLPKYEAGEEIVYTVTEDAVPDYTTEISGYDITNSYAPGKTSVTVTKAWVDNNNCDNHRPDAIKVQLKADGVNSGEEITLNAENNWTYTWSDLDQKKAGKDIAYTVEETGKAAGYISTVTGNAEEGFIITNTITSVKISKVDITDQKELAGAHIQVIDKDGNVVEEWDSTWEAHEVTGLKPGETYTLRETVAPEGYTLTSDTTFTLKEDGTVNKDTTTTTISDNGTLLVEDSRTSVKVSKVDISDGKELEGAHIQIIDQDGNVVDEWDSTKEAHVTEKLKTGKIYTLRETVAPDGYLLTSDTTFVLKEDGTVDAEKTTAVSKDGVLLVQDKLATSASIAVTKKLTYIGENLAARDQTFYVALYSDKECTQRLSDVKALVFKNADASTVVFSENIKAGKTYYIAECTQDGTSQTIGALADGTVYEAVFGNGNSTTVTEANGTTTVSFENVFSSFPPDGFYKQGQLTITKKVLGADGGTRNSNEVFYAGIFDDAAHTQLSQQVEQNIIKLDMDGGYEVSEIINVGLAQSGAKVTLYVTETDSNGKPIAGSEGFGYKVTVSADSVIFDETNMTAEVVITNQEESTVTETPTPTPSSDGGNSGGSENHSGGYGGGKSPKTGDDTPIGTYLMLLLAAAMLAAETERRRRRNKRQ